MEFTLTFALFRSQDKEESRNMFMQFKEITVLVDLSVLLWYNSFFLIIFGLKKIKLLIKAVKTFLC